MSKLTTPMILLLPFLKSKMPTKHPRRSRSYFCKRGLALKSLISLRFKKSHSSSLGVVCRNCSRKLKFCAKRLFKRFRSLKTGWNRPEFPKMRNHLIVTQTIWGATRLLKLVIISLICWLKFKIMVSRRSGSTQSLLKLVKWKRLSMRRR